MAGLLDREITSRRLALRYFALNRGVDPCHRVA
jgi:hypothetical protein